MIAHLLQTVLAIGVIALAVRAHRRIAEIASLDARVDERLRTRPEALAAPLAEHAPTSAQGRLAQAVLEAEEEGGDLGLTLDHAYRAISHDVASELRTLRVVGRLVAMTGAVIAAGFFLKLHLFPRGLEGLVAGALERRATDDATVAIAIGLGTAFVTLIARVALAPIARDTLSRAKKTRDALERRADQPPSTPT